MNPEDFRAQAQIPVVLNPAQSQGAYMAEMTDPGDSLAEMEMILRGLQYDPGSGCQVRVGEQLMNDEGVRQVMLLFRSVFSRNTPMSNLDEKAFQGLMMYTGDTLIMQLMTNRIRWEIANPMTRNLIQTYFMTLAYITLRRPFEEGERHFWKGTSQDIRHSITQGTEKKGWLQGLGLQK
jgi:hypothetical protein